MKLSTSQRVVFVALILLLVQTIALSLFGQPAICQCGYIKLWEGAVQSSGNSQHIFDWYTFTHVIHGFLYYLITWIVFPKTSVGTRFLIALSLEVSWEIAENTPAVIQHYRQQALAAGYVGDSILNSVCDTLAMMVGFCMASRFRVTTVVFLAVFIEIWLALVIRDNLSLNILNLIYIFPEIQTWQLGG